MKRLRAVDVPKFRRPVKTTRARFCPGGFVYLKLLLMWVSCILLDLLIGFRVELLWPLWLMIRHLYDAFRVQNFVSSFHYSAFSVFFVCITATSDLICYLFIPVQVLVFVASTYVWIQFVYQSTERGFCTPSFLLWGLFVGFEYVVRCRFDQSTLYLTRGSWLTAGMFSSTGTDNIFVNNSQESLSRFEIYKPFAAHCLGYPIVTLGFRVKSYFSSWRLKRRKLEVTKENEFYYRLLADAQPAPYDPRQLASSKQLALENADFEIDDENASENGAVITNQPTICTPLNGTTNTNGIFTSSNSSVSTALNRKSRNASAFKSTVPITSNKQQNGLYSANGAVCTTKRTGRAATGTAAKRGDQNEEADSAEMDTVRRRSFSIVRLPIYCFWLSQFICRSAYEYVVAPLWRLLTTQLWSLLKPNKSIVNSDDLLSVSGDGSLLADEESDQEDLISVNKVANDIANTAKRRSKRTRGRTPAVAGEIVTNVAPSQQQIKPQATIAPSFASKPVDPNSMNSFSSLVNSSTLQHNGLNSQLHETDKNDLLLQQQATNGRLKEKSKSQEKCKCSIKVEELESKLKVERGSYRQQTVNMEREKEILEQALDNLRSEMHQIRSNETTVRAELTIVQNQERSQRAEMNQLRTRLNDADQRATQATKQSDKLKKELTSVQSLQQGKRDGARVKRDENTNRSGTPDAQQQQQQPSKELSDMRVRVQTLEKELQTAQSELKVKQQAFIVLEQRAKNAEQTSNAAAKSHQQQIMTSGDTEIKSYQQQITDLQQVNARLEKTLMSENRLKIDLFRALTDSKAQVETMGAKIRQLESGRNGVEPSVVTSRSEFNNPPLPSSLIASLANEFGSGSSSPTDRVSPSSSSSHSIVAANNSISKSSASISEELEQILQSNGQYCYFGGDSFASTATPSTNAAAQALAQQLKMSASPIGTNTLYNSSQKSAQLSSRSTSPSTNELFSIINGKSISSSFGSFGLSNATTTTAPSTSVIGSHLNGSSPAFN